LILLIIQKNINSNNSTNEYLNSNFTINNCILFLLSTKYLINQLKSYDNFNNDNINNIIDSDIKHVTNQKELLNNYENNTFIVRIYNYFLQIIFS